jgi:hypothetical protein
VCCAVLRCAFPSLAPASNAARKPSGSKTTYPAIGLVQSEIVRKSCARAGGDRPCTSASAAARAQVLHVRATSA